MIKINSMGFENPNVEVVANNNQCIAYKMINNQFKEKLEKLEEGEYFTNCNLTKFLLVPTNLEEALPIIAKFKGNIVIHLDGFEGEGILDKAFNVACGLVSVNYNFNLKSVKKDEVVKNYYLTTPLMIEYSRAVSEGVVVGEAINNAKMLVDKPLSHLNSLDLANYCKALATEKLSVKVLGKKEITDLKMDSFLAVNKGSSTEPQLIEMTFKNNPSDEYLWLIGKGLTFDTGGYSLKPSASMINMKSDLGGAASVISAIEAISKLEAEVNVKVLVLATDNKVNSDAIVPDDVISSMAGKTIEIVSTDAEGRLTLCDAITYSIANNAKKIIDLATLTGSAAATFGPLYSAGFSNDKNFITDLMEVSKKNNEPIWELPLDDKYLKFLKSDIADFKNSGKVAGASTAAIFLKQFVTDDVKWIHLDIAPTATKDNLGTGVLVKTLVEYIRTY